MPPLDLPSTAEVEQLRALAGDLLAALGGGDDGEVIPAGWSDSDAGRAKLHFV